MNWLQKISNSFPPSPMSIGHGYRWNEETGKNEEVWQSGDTSPVILWMYDGGQLIESYRTRDNTAHWSDSDDARGRIEMGTGRGSVNFSTINRHLQKRIIEELVDRYPEVRFGVYGVPGAPFSLQEYWNSI